MATELVFNELSLQHQALNAFQANENMDRLIDCCKAVFDFGLKHLRVREDFFQNSLHNGYTIYDWLSDSNVSRDYKNLLLGLKKYPYIPDDDESTIERFVLNNYAIQCPGYSELHGKDTEGLAVAFLYNTLAISLKTHPVWNQTELELIEKNEVQEQSVRVKHFSEPEQVLAHLTWLEENRPLELIQTDLAPEEKQIDLRNDHGQDVLLRFANRLVRSPYVVEVINSLPFNSRTTNFIHNIDSNGLIEIVLTWTDEGFGIVLQSTGRNRQETKAIADLLSKEFNP